jgi:hypothetical protein
VNAIRSTSKKGTPADNSKIMKNELNASMQLIGTYSVVEAERRPNMRTIVALAGFIFVFKDMGRVVAICDAIKTLSVPRLLSAYLIGRNENLYSRNMLH